MTNQETIIITIIFSILISLGMHFLYISWFLNEINESRDFLISPATLHRLTKMNWVGCIIYWIMGIPLAPIFAIPGIFAWLFAVGRK